MREYEPYIPALSYSYFMSTLKANDEALYELASGKLNPYLYQKMIERMRVDRPYYYKELIRCLKGLNSKQDIQEIKKSSYVLADKLIQEYDCAAGFGKAIPEKVTVTVILKEEKKVLGLPKRIISLSNDLARNYGGKRKWTFGFDNRKFTTDLTWAGIDALLRDDKIYDVVVEPTANILTVSPPYDPLTVNTDWGVSRVFPANAWSRGFYGDGIKIVVIDTGIKYTHQAFWKDGVTNFKGGNDFVNGDNDPLDDHDHGTWCCGIIGHQHNGIKGSYRGIAPNAELYSAKVLDCSGSGSVPTSPRLLIGPELT